MAQRPARHDAAAFCGDSRAAGRLADDAAEQFSVAGVATAGDRSDGARVLSGLRGICAARAAAASVARSAVTASGGGLLYAVSDESVTRRVNSPVKRHQVTPALASWAGSIKGDS